MSAGLHPHFSQALFVAVVFLVLVLLDWCLVMGWRGGGGGGYSRLASRDPPAWAGRAFFAEGIAAAHSASGLKLPPPGRWGGEALSAFAGFAGFAAPRTQAAQSSRYRYWSWISWVPSSLTNSRGPKSGSSKTPARAEPSAHRGSSRGATWLHWRGSLSKTL